MHGFNLISQTVLILAGQFRFSYLCPACPASYVPNLAAKMTRLCPDFPMFLPTQQKYVGKMGCGLPKVGVVAPNLRVNFVRINWCSYVLLSNMHISSLSQQFSPPLSQIRTAL
jgi:hypothetical protein